MLPGGVVPLNVFRTHRDSLSSEHDTDILDEEEMRTALKQPYGTNQVPEEYGLSDLIEVVTIEEQQARDRALAAQLEAGLLQADDFAPVTTTSQSQSPRANLPSSQGRSRSTENTSQVPTNGQSLSSMIASEINKIPSSSPIPSSALRSSPPSFPRRFIPTGRHRPLVDPFDPNLDPTALFPLRDFSPSRTGQTYTVDEVLCILWFLSTTHLSFHAIATFFAQVFPNRLLDRQISQYDVHRVLNQALRRAGEWRPWFQGAIQKLQRPTGPEMRVCYFGINCERVRRTVESDAAEGENRMRIAKGIWDFPSPEEEGYVRDTHVCLAGLETWDQWWTIVRYLEYVEISERARLIVKSAITLTFTVAIAAIYSLVYRWGWIQHPYSDRVVQAAQFVGFAAYDGWLEVRRGGKRFLADLLINVFCLVAWASLLKLLWADGVLS